MKNILIAIVLVCVIVSGCDKISADRKKFQEKQTTSEKSVDKNLFSATEAEPVGWATFRVVTFKEAGKRYIFVHTSHGIVLTPIPD